MNSLFLKLVFFLRDKPMKPHMLAWSINKIFKNYIRTCMCPLFRALFEAKKLGKFSRLAAVS